MSRVENLKKKYQAILDLLYGWTEGCHAIKQMEALSGSFWDGDLDGGGSMVNISWGCSYTLKDSSIVQVIMQNWSSFYFLNLNDQ